MKITTYHVASGRLGNLYDVPNPDEQCAAGEAWVEGWHDGAAYYVVAGEVARRPRNPSALGARQIRANGTDLAIITDIPPNSVATIDGPLDAVAPLKHTYVVTDGQLEIAVALQGDYRVTLECPPYQTWWGIIHAS